MKKILIVDDNSFILDGLTITFGMLLKNYETVTAQNGMKALQIMESCSVDLILTDLSMPVMDGYELISYVQKNYPRVPVIVMTGVYTADVADRLHSLGVSQCIEKPFDYEELSRMISRELEGACVVSSPDRKQLVYAS